jgi:hypothetical protein
MFSNINSKEKLLFTLFITTILAFFAGFFVGGLQVAVVVASVSLLFLGITKNIWFSDKSNYLLRMAGIGLSSAVVAATNGLFQPLLLSVIQYFFPNYRLPDFGSPALLYLFALGIVFIIFYFTRDKSIITKEINQKPLHKFIQEPNFEERLKAVKGALRDEINRVDRETNWSASYFTPLDAEVELQTKTGKKKIVADLLTALKDSDERLILVLGEPGGGKSVALRKLSLDLLGIEKDMIPIYINLKEWLPNRKWTESKPPTQDEIKGFILRKLKSSDRITRDFFDEYFDILYENGYLFFIFDSFDELPAILGTKHDSKLIDQISFEFQKFLKGARQERSKGILASREFRKPTNSFDAKATFLIRPFSEIKVVETFQRLKKINEKTVKQLFKECSFLEGHLRNPFTTSLLAEFVSKQNRLPNNIAEVYKQFILDTLNISCKEQLENYNLNSSELYDFMIAMGKTLFENGELEIEIKTLRETLKTENFEEKIQILKFARLIREGQGNKSLLSFSHRRFCEFFAVESLLQQQNLDKKLLTDIPTDSLWRDTLVLYCAVAPFENAKKIANFCWRTLDDYQTLVNRNAIHTLRFMVDAFRGRKECLEDFEKDLSQFILDNIDKNNFFKTKYVVEGIALLDNEDMNEAGIKAFRLGNLLIDGIIMRNSRYINSITNKLEDFLIKKIANEIRVPIGKQKKKNESLLFNLSLLNSESITNKIAQRYSDNLLYLLDGFKIAQVLSFIFFLYILKGNAISLHYVAIIFIFGIILFVLQIILLDILTLFFYHKNKYCKHFMLAIRIDLHSQESIIDLYVNLFFRSILLITIWIILKIIGKLDLWNLILIFFVNPKLFFEDFPDGLKNIPNLIKAFIFYHKNIDFTRLNNREYIYYCYQKTYPFCENLLLDYLEENIHSVHGEYLDDNFFTFQENEDHSRFAQLEAKWRGLE